MPSATLAGLKITSFPSWLIVAAPHHQFHHNNPSSNHPYYPSSPQNPSALPATVRVTPKP
eukprot:scaffold65685_cov30-Cyclotella_meneghiniana.AAC.1